jgi:hypothetical protein
MSVKYLSNNKTISNISDYNIFVKEYINNKYTNITPNFKDNKILYSNFIINLKYNKNDINDLIFLSNDKNLVIIFMSKDYKKIYYINIFNIHEDSKNNINIENIMYIDWISKSNDYTLLIIIIVLLSLICFVFIMVIIYKYSKDSNYNNNNNYNNFNNNNNNFNNFDNYE